MLYTLSTGRVERNISKQLRQAKATSKAISQRPVLLPGLKLFYDAFFQLSLEREKGKVIPTGTVMQYARDYGYSDEIRFEMVSLIRKMDLAYLKHRAKNEDASRPSEDDESPKGKNSRVGK